MKFFREKPSEVDAPEAQVSTALCSFSARQTSWLIVLLVLAGAALFVSGYMVGKTAVMRSVTDKVIDDSFEDRAQYALHQMYGKPEDSSDDSASDVSAEEDEPETLYYAQLIGFGVKQNAEQFINRVKKMGIPVTLKTRVSKKPRGNTITWYQVTTDEYPSEEALRTDLAKLSKRENLKNIRIQSRTR